MDEIKVGEYVKSYCIFKVVSIDTTKDGKYYRGDIPEWIGAWEEDIKSHSPNIIDLVEKDDYVNGYRVEEIGQTYIGKVKYLIDSLDRCIYEENIKSVVTHEEFENMKYVVGGTEE